MKRKLAFVVQRYGMEVNGGAETLAREIVEHLSKDYEVEVLTTKAVDYMSWANYYTEDVSDIHGVTVRRFAVEQERNTKKFGHACGKVLEQPEHTMEQENEWFDLQGPLTPALIQYIEDHSDDYDAFLFMTYLYYTTVKGLPKVADKAIMIPTAHDEPPIYLHTFEEIFKIPKGIFYLTQEEKAFVEKKFQNSDILNNDGLGGSGIEVPEKNDPDWIRKKYGIDSYMVYAGRIDTSKGCKELFRFYKKYRRRHKDGLKLVMIGKPVIRIPRCKDIISLGFVDEDVKYHIMSGAQFLVMPSPFESLSIVVLESLALKVPVLCNGRCEVLKGHCIKSQAGLYYEDYDSFEQGIRQIMESESKRAAMGENGAVYVQDHYTWDKIMARMNALIEQI